jgi:hypothetical protein
MMFKAVAMATLALGVAAHDGCPQQGEAVHPGPVDGFKLLLKYSGRIYTYHTDRRSVRPCPAIEAS